MVADPGLEPARRCPVHRDEPAQHPCGACGDWRDAHDEWAHRKRLYDAEQRAGVAAEHARIRALEIARCNYCNDEGRGPNGLPCHHGPPPSAAARDSIAAARAALTKPTTR